MDPPSPPAPFVPIPYPNTGMNSDTKKRQAARADYEVWNYPVYKFREGSLPIVVHFLDASRSPFTADTVSYEMGHNVGAAAARSFHHHHLHLGKEFLPPRLLLLHRVAEAGKGGLLGHRERSLNSP